MIALSQVMVCSSIALAITEPADICPASSNWIELKIGRTRHPGPILEHEGNSAIPQEARKFGVEPIAIPNLNCEFVRIRELCEEWNEAVQKLVTILKRRLIEEGELENYGAELVPRTSIVLRNSASSVSHPARAFS